MRSYRKVMNKTGVAVPVLQGGRLQATVAWYF